MNRIISRLEFPGGWMLVGQRPEAADPGCAAASTPGM